MACGCGHYPVERKLGMMDRAKIIKSLDSVKIVIQGGNSVNYSVGSHSYVLRGQYVGEIADRMMKINKSLGVYKSKDQCEEWILSYWEAKDPEGFSKYMVDPVDPKSSVTTKATREEHMALIRNPMNVDRIGPMIWNYLNLFGLCFDYKTWMCTIEMITNLLNPNTAKSDSAGCAKCYTHWVEMIDKDPPSRVSNKYEAAKWVNRIHNNVNRMAGKREQPYSFMVRAFGSPIPVKDK